MSYGTFIHSDFNFIFAGDNFDYGVIVSVQAQDII